ncbi:MAG: nucleotidyltransferase family protein [Microcystaceae cyanobacterium]
MSIIKEYPPEFKVLLYCSSACLDSKNAERLKQVIQGGLDWDYLLKIAKQHKLKPLLYWHLHKTCPEFVPEEIFAELQKYFNDNTQRNECLTQELFRLLNLFEKEGISVLPYKGPTLALSTHGNLAIRHWWDLDLLVDISYFQKAKDLLIDQGYQPQKQLSWEESLINQKTGVSVDLHQNITSDYFPLKYDFQHFWQRSELENFYDTNIHCFLPEDLLIILCVQVVKDSWENKIRLVKICDVAELIITSEGLKWEKVLEESHTLGCDRVLFLALFLTKHFMAITLPEIITKKIQTDLIVKLYADRFCQRILAEKQQELTKKLMLTNWLTRQEERLALYIPRLIS